MNAKSLNGFSKTLEKSNKSAKVQFPPPSNKFGVKCKSSWI